MELLRVQIALLKYSVLISVEMHQTKVHIFNGYVNRWIMVTAKLCHIVASISMF